MLSFTITAARAAKPSFCDTREQPVIWVVDLSFSEHLHKAASEKHDIDNTYHLYFEGKPSYCDSLILHQAVGSTVKIFDRTEISDPNPVQMTFSKARLIKTGGSASIATDGRAMFTFGVTSGVDIKATYIPPFPELNTRTGYTLGPYGFQGVMDGSAIIRGHDIISHGILVEYSLLAFPLPSPCNTSILQDHPPSYSGPTISIDRASPHEKELGRQRFLNYVDFLKEHPGTDYQLYLFILSSEAQQRQDPVAWLSQFDMGSSDFLKLSENNHTHESAGDHLESLPRDPSDLGETDGSKVNLKNSEKPEGRLSSCSQKTVSQEIKSDVDSILIRLIQGVSEKTGKTIEGWKTIALALVEDEEGYKTLVYTTNNNYSSDNLRDEAKKLGIEWWNPDLVDGVRGPDGAPNDAEQLLLDFASHDPTGKWKILHLVTSRGMCPDCKAVVQPHFE